MATIKIEDPEEYKKAEVNQGGQIYIGKDHSGEKVKVVIEGYIDT